MAETMGADRTAAADATVTNESLILSISFRARDFVGGAILCAGKKCNIHRERSHVLTALVFSCGYYAASKASGR